MNGLSLCSGIGGLDLGVKLAVPQYRTITYVELEPFAQDVLLARMADGVLDRAPIWGDLKRFDATAYRGLVDLVHGGYPCQPFSVAGKRDGADDPRHLWPNVARIVRECEPEWCFFENVAGHLTLGFDKVAESLEAMGYSVAAGLFTAAEVGAPHRRQRLFILAHAVGRELRLQPWRGSRSSGASEALALEHGEARNMAHASCEGLPQRQEHELLVQRQAAVGGGWWAAEPGVGRVADGAPNRVDRLKALGNAVVPEVAALAWRTLIESL